MHTYAFAVKKGQNPELLNMFNEGLKELKRTGEYDKIIKEYVADGSESSSDSSARESFAKVLLTMLDSCFG